MAFATETIGNTEVIPGTVDNVAGSIPPPPGFEVPPTAPSYDALMGTQSSEHSAEELADTVEVPASQEHDIAEPQMTEDAGLPDGPVDYDGERILALEVEQDSATTGALSSEQEASIDEDKSGIDVSNSGTVNGAELDLFGESSPAEESAPVSSPTTATPAQEEERVLEGIGSSSRVYSRRVDQPNAEYVIGRARNVNLNYAMELYFSASNPNGGQVDDDLPIQGEIINKTGGYGLWEEGGSIGSEARAILATNPDGSAPMPFYVFDKNNVVNGKHALVPIQEGSYIVLGGRKKNSSVILVYRVDGIDEIIVPNKEGGAVIPSYKGRLVAYQAYSIAAPDMPDLQCVEEEGSPEHQRWHTNHPAIVAMRHRLIQLHANGPAYVVAYQENRFDSTDYNDCLNDAEFRGRMETEPSLDAAYAKVGDILGNLISNGIKNGEHPHLVVSLNYFPEKDTIAVFCMAKVYAANLKSSRGKRLHFSRVLLKAGSSFYYPDKTTENAVPFDRLKEILTRVGGAMASSFRRRIGV